MAMPSIVQITVGYRIRNKMDFLNKKTALMFTGLLSVLVFILYIFVRNVYIIPVIRFFHSIVLSAGILFGMALAVDLIPPDKRKSGIGLYSLTGALPFLFAPMTAEFITRYFSFKYVFILAAFISLLRVIITRFINVPDKKVRTAVLQKTHYRDYINVIPYVIFYGALYAALYKFLSAYSLQLKILYVSAFFQARVILTFAVRLIFHRNIDKWNNYKIILTSFISGFVVLFLAFLLKFKPEIYILIIMGGVYGSIHGVLYPALSDVFIKKTPDCAGKATMVFMLTKNLGIALFALFCGFIADYIGYNKMYFIMSFLMLIPVFCILINKKNELIIEND